MLVRPCGPAAVLTDDLEKRIHLDEIVRIDRDAFPVDQTHRQFRRIDLRQGIAERSAPGNELRVYIDAFVEQSLSAREALTIGPWGKQVTIVGIIVKYAG